MENAMSEEAFKKDQQDYADFMVGRQVLRDCTRALDQTISTEKVSLKIGALVRLVREIVKKADEVIQAGDDVEPDIIAWLAEARALVGEVTDER